MEGGVTAGLRVQVRAISQKAVFILLQLHRALLELKGRQTRYSPFISMPSGPTALQKGRGRLKKIACERKYISNSLKVNDGWNVLRTLQS